MYQAIFLFDYIQFRQEAEPFIEMADKGSYTPIIAKANDIASQIVPKGWILEDMGTTLKKFQKFQEDGEIGHVTGFSFLVLLSQFLKRDPSSAPGLDNVAKVLKLSDWFPKDIELLRRGMSTTVLLKPTGFDDVLKRPPAKDSRWHLPAYYWWWLRPEYSFETGWWGIQQLTNLRDKLLESEQFIENVDLEQLNLHPSVTKHTVRDHYEQTLQLFELSINQGIGLLSITR